MDDAARVIERHRPRLERVIGTGALAGAAINCILGAGIFGLPGAAAAMLGPAAVLAYLLCALLIGLVGLCFAEIGSRVVDAGGVYAYATAAFGPVTGGVTGTLMWAANSVVPSAAVANLLMDTLATPLPALAGGAPRIAALFAVYVVLCAVNIRGVRSGARVSMALAFVKIAPLVVLVAAGLFTMSRANLHWTTVPSIAAIGQTSVLLFFAFIGVEGGLNASGEVANPARTVPRAILLALTVVAALYVGLQTIAQGVLGPRLPGETAPLVATAAAMYGPWGARLLMATTAVSVAGFLSADMLGSPRIFHAMSERRQLPAWLSAVHLRFRTPAVAIALYGLMCAVVASTGSFRQLALAASSGTLVIYLICCIGVFPLRRRNTATTGVPFVAPGGALVPLAASAIILWMLSTLAAAEIAAAVGLVVVAAVGYVLQQTFWRKPDAEPASAVPVAAGAIAALRARRRQPPSA